MGGRRRAAVELIAREGTELRGTAARYSLCAEDAEDAYQRALEILLLKAPTEQPPELLRWTKTVVKHEALAVRQSRERLLGPPAPWDEDEDPGTRAARVPALEDGPDERLESSEDLARTREALRALKPAELRSLTLLAAGYSYAEIAARTGYSRRKVNRALAEGRERFRALVARSEDGTRCAEMAPRLSAFCDGEATDEQARAVREHLRACAGCRAAMRAYRSAPAAAAALAPALPASRSLLERAQEAFAGVYTRLPGSGGGAEAGAAQIAAAGGTRGGGMAALAKVLTICAGTAGGAAACVAGGVAPAPLGLAPDGGERPAIEREARSASAGVAPPVVDYEPAPEPAPPPEPEPAPEPVAEPEPEAVPVAAEAGAVEYAPPAPEPSPQATASAPTSSGSSSGSAAGEFGP